MTLTPNPLQFVTMLFKAFPIMPLTHLFGTLEKVDFDPGYFQVNCMLKDTVVSLPPEPCCVCGKSSGNCFVDYYCTDSSGRKLIFCDTCYKALIRANPNPPRKYENMMETRHNYGKPLNGYFSRQPKDIKVAPDGHWSDQVREELKEIKRSEKNFKKTVMRYRVPGCPGTKR